MDLLLHIGTEKTGSTSLQHWFDANSDRLTQAGIWYSRCMGRLDHRRIAVYAMDADKADAGFLSLGLKNHHDHRQWRGRLRDDLVRDLEEARAAGATTYVLSSEHCHSRLTSEQMVARLADLVMSLFDRIDILCCLRPQVDLLISCVSTHLKEGEMLTEDLLEIDSSDPYYDYLALYRRWNRVFKDRVRLFAYKRHADVVDFVSIALGLKKENYIDIPRKNTALDYRVLALCANVSIDGLPAGSRNMVPPFIIDRYPCNEPLTIDRSEAARIELLFEDGNRALVEAYDGLEMSDLTVDLTRIPEQGNFAKIRQPVEFKDVLSEMVRRYNFELGLERALRGRTQARLAKVRGDDLRARTLAERAKHQLDHAKAAAFDDRSSDIEQLENALRRLLGDPN